MNDPFSKAIRRYHSWPQCKKFERELATNSMIQTSRCSTNQIQNRIGELQRYEDEFGFVYFAEKQWLKAQLREGVEKPYREWVLQQLNDLIFPEGLVLVEPESGQKESNQNYRYWQGYTEDLNFLISFKELQSESIEMDNLLLKIPGNEASPNLDHTTTAFHLLHNLSYFLHMAGQRLSGVAYEFNLDEIVLLSDRGRWVMTVITEYGGGMDFEFNQDGIR